MVGHSNQPVDRCDVLDTQALWLVVKGHWAVRKDGRTYQDARHGECGERGALADVWNIEVAPQSRDLYGENERKCDSGR